MNDPQHEETFADTERKLREIITTLRAQLARREEMHDCAMKERDDTTLYADELRMSLRRAEAALAAQIEVDAGLLLDAYKAVLVLHRVMNKHGLTAGEEAAKNIADRIVAAHPEFPGLCALRGPAQPHDRTALDRMLAEAREKALLGAAQVLTDEIDLARIAMPQVIPILSADRKAILALIEKPNAR